MDVELRDVTAEDVDAFFHHQADPVSSSMAAVASRDLDAHRMHWTESLNPATTVAKTIVFEGEVAGHCVSWVVHERRYVGYWIDRQMWGRGIASEALKRFVEIVTERPLIATVAPHNAASRRVLEKAGFIPTGEVPDPSGHTASAEWISNVIVYVHD